MDDEDMVLQDSMTQVAPFPHALHALVRRLRYRPGWRFTLDDIVRDPAESHGAEAAGLTFIVTTNTINAYHPDQKVTVNHYFPVPAATYNRESWRRWLLDCLLKVEAHECMEFFAFALAVPVDGEDQAVDRPFAPTHGPGDDPYVVHEYASDEQRRTRYTGEVLA